MVYGLVHGHVCGGHKETSGGYKETTVEVSSG